jgi:hypothetical protein
MDRPIENLIYRFKSELLPVNIIKSVHTRCDRGGTDNSLVDVREMGVGYPVDFIAKSFHLFSIDCIVDYQICIVRA